jgi:transposase
MPSKPVRRRRHSPELKAKVVAACAAPGASVAAVALAHDLNANLVHKWRRGQGLGPMRGRVPVPPRSVGVARPEFVALSLPAALPSVAKPTAAAHIHIAIERAGSSVAVSWPVTAAAACGAWLREWLR